MKITGGIELLQTRSPIMGVLLKNGDAVMADDNGMPYCNYYIDRASGKSYKLAEFLKKSYGMDVQETILVQLGAIQDISSDERTGVGYGGIYGMAMGTIVYQLGDTSGDPELASVLKTQIFFFRQRYPKTEISLLKSLRVIKLRCPIWQVKFAKLL